MDWHNFYRGELEELIKYRNKIIAYWRLYHPTEKRPLSCVDCLRRYCFEDCHGIEDRRVKKLK